MLERDVGWRVHQAKRCKEKLKYERLMPRFVYSKSARAVLKSNWKTRTLLHVQGYLHSIYPLPYPLPRIQMLYLAHDLCFDIPINYCLPDGRCTREIKSRTALAKASFSKKKAVCNCVWSWITNIEETLAPLGLLPRGKKRDTELEIYTDSVSIVSINMRIVSLWFHCAGPVQPAWFVQEAQMFSPRHVVTAWTMPPLKTEKILTIFNLKLLIHYIPPPRNILLQNQPNAHTAYKSLPSLTIATCFDTPVPSSGSSNTEFKTW